ncbi:MAG: hypothetical protein AAFX76_07880 [Planctomycetota bacterium]
MLFTTVLGSAWVAWTNARGQRAAEAVVTEFHDRYPDFDSSSPHLHHPDNGAPLFFAAATVLKNDHDHEEDVPVFGSADWLDFGYPVSAEQQQILEQILEPNHAAFRLAPEARTKPTFHYDAKTGIFAEQSLHILSRLRHLARWLAVEAQHHAVRSDGEAATETITLIHHLSHSMSNDHNVLFNLVQTSIDALAIGVGEDVLSRGEMGVGALTRIQDAVRLDLRHTSLANALIGEAFGIAEVIEDADLLVDAVAVIDLRFHFATSQMQRMMGGEAQTTAPWWRELLDDTCYRFKNAVARLVPGKTQLEAAAGIRFALDVADAVRDGKPLDDNVI